MEQFEGEAVAGSYKDVLSRIAKPAFSPRAAIVLFARGVGQEEFLESWQQLFPRLPVVGGAAARSNGADAGDVLPLAADVAVLLICKGTWATETLNLHELSGTEWQFQAEGPRTIARLRPAKSGEWQPAATAFRSQQTACGRNAEDCESITISDRDGRNLHVSISGDELHVGANLPAEGGLFFRAVHPAAVARKFQDFCAHPDTLVCGCAGLRSLIKEPLILPRNTLAGFLFGEVVTVAGQPRFGNLMAARLRRLELPKSD
ncbi:MAG TPA: hypothetical protein VKY92_26260 [Verrucomicrobiae bacterium]|nr:hypothetical protein [Verrucomicrobiae bacterium]